MAAPAPLRLPGSREATHREEVSSSAEMYQALAAAQTAARLLHAEQAAVRFPVSSLSIRGMPKNTGSHLCTFQILLMRIPMMNTTKSPSDLRADALGTDTGH